jgi:hypothetical protein
MHVLQYIAVKPKGTFHIDELDQFKEEAFDDVKLKFEEMYSESEGLGGWSDWYVVGGGRWNSNPDNQYEEKNAWNDVISYAETPDKFVETITRAIESRKIEFKGYRERFEAQNLDIIAKLDSFDGAMDYAMELYDLSKCIDMLQGKWDMNSYFYDLNNWSTNPKWVLDSLDDSWYLVPVDFHF